VYLEATSGAWRPCPPLAARWSRGTMTVIQSVAARSGPLCSTTTMVTRPAMFLDLWQLP